MDQLKKLQRDKALCSAVQESLQQFNKDTAGNMSVAGKDASWARETANLISLYFQVLESTYGDKKKPKVEEPE